MTSDNTSSSSDQSPFYRPVFVPIPVKPVELQKLELQALLASDFFKEPVNDEPVSSSSSFSQKLRLVHQLMCIPQETSAGPEDDCDTDDSSVTFNNWEYGSSTSEESFDDEPGPVSDDSCFLKRSL